MGPRNLFMAMLLTILLAPTIALADETPPPISDWVSSLPNGGGTLHLKFCTIAGWPCVSVKQKVWGQICYPGFVRRYMEDERADRAIFPFTKYAGWACPGYRRSAECEEAGDACDYSDGGPAP